MEHQILGIDICVIRAGFWQILISINFILSQSGTLAYG